MPPDGFARTWYAARDAGERLRGQALEWLYQHPSSGRPGGRHPDPRLPSAYSWFTLVRVAAWQLSLELLEVADAAALADVDAAVPGQRMPRWSWLLIYPGPERLTMGYRPVQWDDAPTYGLACFEMAMLLGDYCRNYSTLSDPAYPAGYYVPSVARGHVACLHQFAHAFLRTRTDCPAEWGCDCGRIRANMSLAPDEHRQATDALLLADLRDDLLRMQERADARLGQPQRTEPPWGQSWDVPAPGQLRSRRGTEPKPSENDER